MHLFFWIALICSGPTCVSFVQPLYVCLYHITQFFPQQGRLRGPAKTPNANHSTPLLCLHEETATGKWRRGTNPGKCRPFGFLTDRYLCARVCVNVTIFADVEVMMSVTGGELNPVR